MLVDSIDNHLREALEFDKAAMPLGMYLAWCVNHGLVSEAILREHETLVTRIRMHDARGSELLIAIGGELRLADLNEQGRDFTERYYGEFLQDFGEAFGGSFYDTKDDWDSYARIAPVLTARLLGPKGKSHYPGLLGSLRDRIKRIWHSSHRRA